MSFLFDDGTENLGGGYKYTCDTDLSIHGPGITVPPEIIEYKYDDRFIVVKQRLNGLKPQRDYYDLYDYNYPLLYGDYYWIIDKQEGTFYGPLDKSEFIRKTDSIDVKLSLDTL